MRKPTLLTLTQYLQALQAVVSAIALVYAVTWADHTYEVIALQLRNSMAHHKALKTYRCSPVGYMKPATWALVAAVLNLCSLLSSAELVMVYSIQRHGARNVLPKSSILTESEATGGPTLLPQGQRQCFEAGLVFAARYINPETCNATSTCLPASETGIRYGVLGKPGIGFSNYNTYANTSALDRTIMSADSFLEGVFPPTNNATNDVFLPTGQQLVPVYSVADTEDWKIRGYTKCPTYQQRLEQWLGSDEFKAKAAETEDFRNEMQQLVPQLNVSLANWWNVYDAYNVWRNYQVGDAMPDISADMYNKTVALAMWLETAKMRPELTGNLLGGGLLGDMLTRITTAQQTRSRDSQAHYRLLTVSSHYNAQLGLLSALQSGTKQTSYLWQSKIPSLAAALVFELHVNPDTISQSSNQTPLEGFAIRAVYQDGPKAKYAVLPLPCAEKGDAAEQMLGAGSCTLESFMTLAAPLAFYSSRDWCDACNNKQVLACEVSRMERQLAEAGLSPAGDGSSSSSSAGRSSSSPEAIALWVLVSLIGAGLLAAGVVLGVRRYKQQPRSQAGPDKDVSGLRPTQDII